MPATFDQFMDYLRAATGAREDSSFTLQGYWNRLRRKEVTWVLRRKGKIAAGGYVGGALATMLAQTDSVSTTQPVTPSVVTECSNACSLKAAYFLPNASHTLSTTDTCTYTLYYKKSATYSATFGLATLVTNSTFTPNIAGARVSMTLESTTPGNLDIPAGATVWHRATKAGASPGAGIALGGTFTMVFEEN